MEFLSLYSLQVNRATSAMLRLNENEDILRQLSHLTRKTLIRFAYLPRLLTMELNVRLVRLAASWILWGMKFYQRIYGVMPSSKLIWWSVDPKLNII